MSATLALTMRAVTSTPLMSPRCTSSKMAAKSSWRTEPECLHAGLGLYHATAQGPERCLQREEVGGLVIHQKETGRGRRAAGSRMRGNTRSGRRGTLPGVVRWGAARLFRTGRPACHHGLLQQSAMYAAIAAGGAPGAERLEGSGTSWRLPVGDGRASPEVPTARRWPVNRTHSEGNGTVSGAVAQSPGLKVRASPSAATLGKAPPNTGRGVTSGPTLPFGNRLGGAGLARVHVRHVAAVTQVELHLAREELVAVNK